MANEFSAHIGLGALFVERGDACPAAARRPVSLCGSGNVWLVEEGVIDVLAARHDSGQMVSAYKHFVRLEIGRLAFSVNESNHGMRLVAKGLPGSKLRRLTHECLFDALAEGDDADAIRAEFGRHVDFWIESLSSAVSREMEGIPATELRLRPGSMTGSGVASPGHGVVWLATGGIEAGFLDLADTGGQELVPVSRDAWIRLHGEEALECRTTAELDARRLLNENLPGFHKILFEVESLGQRLLLVDEANLQAAQATRRRDDKARARTSLEALYSPGLTTAKDGPAMAEALRMIGRREGFDVRVPAVVGGDEPSLDSICDASMLRKRKVRLKATEQWWFGDSGAMLAIRREDGQSLALLPGMAGRYRVANPSTGDSRPADGRTATSFREVHCLYPGLSDSRADGTAGLRSLFRAGCCGVAGDVAILVATGIVAGTLALTPAFAVSWLATAAALGGKAIPALQLAAILAGTGALVALLHILRGTALMRVEGRVAARLSALVWDRLLRLGAGFFRGQTAGELSARSLVFQDVRDRVAGVTADGVLSTLFLLPALGLLFLYDAWLGWSALLLSAAMIGVTAIFCILMIGPQRRYLETMRRLAGDTQQFLMGISKLRTTAAEDSAFAAWARRYHGHKKAEIRLSMLGEHLAAFGAAVPALASAVLFWTVVVRGGVDTADFLAIFTAVMVLCMTTVMLGNAARAVAFVKPACDQVRPVLASPAPARMAGRARAALSGRILVDRASYAYSPGGPNVLEDVSISAKPGELVAIVGESGAGKTTLLRLLLGLERPQSGAIYYDGQDLAQLDFAVVRRQMGVVMQDGTLRPCSVLDNVIGADSRLTEDDAWRALEQAGVADDIRAMPMGLHTSVGENSANLSGGQSQRIRMAAALVHRPRILFLDEPTSWLDTRSQALAMKGIEESTSTRVVIAHRLSTIRNADRIHVLHRGCLVQVGSYDELLAAEGKFRDLALRQTA
ncbi:MAG: ATP-binding cassette domain-containing protein [Alphaproteobacteria bacterium]|nr:ATP-binding cassette domain-containing protein [Alphaproteobacteria bacterium]